jgi:hypothetical protein
MFLEKVKQMIYNAEQNIVIFQWRADQLIDIEKQEIHIEYIFIVFMV